MFGWTYQGKAFDVAVHLGSLVALIAFFWKDWIAIISSFLKHHFRGHSYDKDNPNASGKLLVPILIACIPAAVVGVVWEDVIENQLNKWQFVAAAMVVFAVIMLIADQIGKKQRDISRMNYIDYILIGFAQAIALFPGVSRSGITITAGLFRNLDRAAAARFSFLLSTPIVLGAGLVAMKDAIIEGILVHEMTAFISGFFSAAIFGFIAIKFLINYLQKRTMIIFVAYRILFAGFMVLIFIFK